MAADCELDGFATADFGCCIVMAYIVMAYIVMAYIGMASTDLPRPTSASAANGLYSGYTCYYYSYSSFRSSLLLFFIQVILYYYYYYSLFRLYFIIIIVILYSGYTLLLLLLLLFFIQVILCWLHLASRVYGHIQAAFAKTKIRFARARV